MDRKFLKAGALALGGLVMAAGAHAGTVTLNTAGNKAVSTLVMSKAAQDLSKQSGISYGAAGNAYTGSTAGTFVLPVTQAVLNVGLFSPTTPISGKSIGSAITISKGTKLSALANFSVDYGTKTITGDFINNGASTSLALFAFKEQTPLKLSLRGLTLTMNQTLGNLKLTSQANTAIGSALGLSSGLQSSFGALDFGTITIDIASTSRKAVSTKAFTAAMLVPEPSTYALMGLGLAGIGFVARRKARA
jgi:PEP-CTERM motif